MRKIYIIEGLDCPNCAKMVENHFGRYGAERLPCACYRRK